MLANRFGQFDSTGRAFTITDHRTPMPWVNVISNGRYGLVISQNGGGFSWFDDAQHNVLTRWEMDLVRDCYGKFLYLSDLETGEVWSAAPAPCFPVYAAYSCTHTLGSTTFVTEHAGIRIRWTLSVAHDSQAEVWLVELTNLTDRPRSIRLSSYFEWTCGVAPDVKREFHRLFFTTTHDTPRRAIIAGKNMWDIPRKTEREHWNVGWPYRAAHSVGGFTFRDEIAIADKSRFLGRYTNTSRPQSMQASAPTSTDGGFGRFGDACAALGGTLALAPRQTAKGHFTIAVGEDQQQLLDTIDRFRETSGVTSAIANAEHAWVRRLSPTAIATASADFDLLNNSWLPYQAISARLWGRTGYYQQSGAFGFRDQLQDSQVWLALDPNATRQQIMKHAARQFWDGSVDHWWHALADFGNHTACSDDYLWLAFTTAAYLKETGDFAALEARAPYRDGGLTAPAPDPVDKNGALPWNVEERALLRQMAGTSVPRDGALLEHCLKSIRRALVRRSKRGLPFIGSCDWNDGLSAMGVGEKGESIWLGMFLCQILDDWSIILDRVGSSTVAAEFRAERAAITKAMNTHAWDGAWYRYGTKDSGEWVGASTCEAGQIHLNAQTWSILSDIAPADRAAAAWASVKHRLLSDYGPLLLAPAYTTPDTDLGYVTRYSPGSRENGGVYMHAATWALAAACKMRDADSVSRIWKSISPATRGQDADNYWAEPYATPGNVDGPLSDKPGRAGWTWYTGSAAWLNRVCLEWVLGIRPVWDANNQSEGLLIDPCPPLELGKVNVTRTWRGQPIRVRFDAAEFSPDRRAVLVVDGETIVGNVLPEELVSRTSLAGPLAGPLAGQKRTPIDVLVKWTAAPASEIELSRAVAARNGMSKPSASQPREKPVSPAPRP